MELNNILSSFLPQNIVMIIQVSVVLECILPQNGTRFAAKWNAFCRKMEK